MSCSFSIGHYRDLLVAANDSGYRWTAFGQEPEPGDLFLGTTSTSRSTPRSRWPSSRRSSARGPRTS